MIQATSPTALRSLLERYHLSPRKGLGQHFLWQQRVAGRMADAAELGPDDLVLEIGPGLGILTAACAERAGLVIAVEIDHALLPLLESELQGYPNVRLVQGDARKTDWSGLVRRLAPPHFWGESAAGRCKVVGNLPYYLTSPLLTGLLSGNLKVELMVLMVQQEVAERIVAGPGSKAYGSLSVYTRYYSVPELLFSVSPHEFWPRPEVTSAVIRLRLRSQPEASVRDPGLFFQVVRAAFRYRRKTLKNALGEAGLLPGSAPREERPAIAGPGEPPVAGTVSAADSFPAGAEGEAGEETGTLQAEALFEAAGIDPAGAERRWISPSLPAWRRRWRRCVKGRYPMHFISPSKGVLSWDEVVTDLLDYVTREPDYSYKIIIGTDSHVRDDTHFVTALVVHRVGKGARYFYRRKIYEKIKSLRQKIFFEAAFSLEVASNLAQSLAERGHTELDLEIHLDIGHNGETKGRSGTSWG